MIRDDAEMDEEIERQLESEIRIQAFNEQCLQLGDDDALRKNTSLPPNFDLNSHVSTGLFWIKLIIEKVYSDLPFARYILRIIN